MARYVFLDRDGTLVRDPGYVHRISDYELLDGVADGLRRLQAAGYGLAIVTNQSGIGRGLFTEADFHAFQKHLIADLERQGVRIEATFYCPHAPEADCACRKPRPGLFEQAAKHLGADLPQCWMIGDSARDAEAAAGLQGAVWIGGAGKALPAGCLSASDFAQAAERIVETTASRVGTREG